MAKMCDECLEVYGSEDLSNKPYVSRDGDIFSLCPKRGCHGEIVEIDDIILPAIRSLNGLGYYTIESCAGHIEDKFTTKTYIKFDAGVVIDEKTLPSGFKMRIDVDEDTMEEFPVVYKNVLITTETKAFQEILTNGLMLFVWASTLNPPEYKLSGFAAMIFGPEFIEELSGGSAAPEKKAGHVMDLEKLKKEVAKGKGTITFKELLNKGEPEETKEPEAPVPEAQDAAPEEEKEKPKARKTRKVEKKDNGESKE